jgi:hypothetical protein
MFDFVSDHVFLGSILRDVSTSDAFGRLFRIRMNDCISGWSRYAVS